MRSPTLVVMVKEPRAGRVKTRLARGIGRVAATAFYRHATAALLQRLGQQAFTPRPVATPSRGGRNRGAAEWRIVLAVAPDIAAGSAVWPLAFDRVAQGRGDLGQRMQRIMDGLPPGPVVIIGSDCPDLRPHHIRSAFRALGTNDAVLGPASDGGYWLVGLKRFPRVPRAFDNVRWSTEHALADTEANLKGRRIAHLATLDDVDEAADLVRDGGRYSRRVGD